MQFKKLTKAEEEVMQGIWDLKACTVSQLIHHLDKPETPHSTISSIVRILEKKGFVDHKTYGRTYEYFPIIDKKSYSKFSLKNLVAHYFAGSPNELVSFLVKENDISIDELNELINTLQNKTK